VWDCKKCQERVEDSFEVCWNCGTSRDGVEDPAFRREADAELVGQEAAEPGQGVAEHVQPVGARPAVARKRKARRGPIVTTGNEVGGRQITAYLGIVRGIVVRSPSITQGIFGGLQQIVGGNIEAFAEVCEAARQEAFERMVAHAAEIGADAVIAMRYDATEFATGVTEVLAYGTAVRLA
jgi:uncharacterized protein YbjQ (UPF0145 family)